MPPPHLAGLLLTGGSSRRMGRDKATLRRAGVSWAERLAHELRALTNPCLEIGGQASGLPSVPDDQPGQGPLAAMATGWAALERAGQHGPALVVATDLPFAGPAALGLLAGWPGHGSVVPVVDGRPQLLCARWSAAALASCAPRVESGQRAVAGLLDVPDLTLLHPDEWSAVVPTREWLDVDTPEDLVRSGLDVA